MKGPAPSRPRVSVILPCRNGAGSLGAVLDALRGQTYPAGRVERIVVDNGSSDGSREIALRHGARLLEEPVRSAYAARNRGIRAAEGEILLFLDADTVPCPGWIEAMVETAESSGSPMVGGRIENEIVRPALGSLLLALTRSAERRRAGIERDGRLSGGNMLVRRALFDRHGLFLPVASGADGEFSRRANPERRPIPYAEAAVVRHRCDLTAAGYLARAYREARGQAQCRGTKAGRRGPLPWRPGLRRAAALRREILGRWGPRAGPLLLPRLAVVLWLENWAIFLGGRADPVRREGIGP